jgi:7-carboxy-7-deazaguanine synthase
LAGCNLRCRYCDTPDSLERTAGYTIFRSGHPPVTGANPVSATDLVGVIAAILESDAPIDAIALTGGEPLTQSDFLAACLDAGRFPVPVLLETNGVLPHRLRDVLPFVDIISMDIKPPSNTGEGAFWEEHAAFLGLARTKDLSVKILVDQSTADEDVERAASLLAPIQPAVPVFLQPIVDVAGRSLIDAERLTRFYVLARRQVESLRVLPQTHKLLGVR